MRPNPQSSRHSSAPLRVAVLPEVFGLVTNQGAIASKEALVQTIKGALWHVAPPTERHQLQLVYAYVTLLNQLGIRLQKSRGIWKLTREQEM
jgi:hypothetical protein